MSKLVTVGEPLLCSPHGHPGHRVPRVHRAHLAASMGPSLLQAQETPEGSLVCGALAQGQPQLTLEETRSFPMVPQKTWKWTLISLHLPTVLLPGASPSQDVTVKGPQG